LLAGCAVPAEGYHGVAPPSKTGGVWLRGSGSDWAWVAGGGGLGIAGGLIAGGPEPPRDPCRSKDDRHGLAQWSTPDRSHRASFKRNFQLDCWQYRRLRSRPQGGRPTLRDMIDCIGNVIEKGKLILREHEYIWH